MSLIYVYKIPKKRSKDINTRKSLYNNHTVPHIQVHVPENVQQTQFGQVLPHGPSSKLEHLPHLFQGKKLQHRSIFYPYTQNTPIQKDQSMSTSLNTQLYKLGGYSFGGQSTPSNQSKITGQDKRAEGICSESKKTSHLSGSISQNIQSKLPHYNINHKSEVIINIGIIGIQPTSIDTFGLKMAHSPRNQVYSVIYSVSDPPSKIRVRVQYCSKSILLDELQTLQMYQARFFQVNPGYKVRRTLQISNHAKILGNYTRKYKKTQRFPPTLDVSLEGRYIEIMRLLIHEQRLGFIPFVTSHQKLIASQKGIEVGADMIRGQCGIAIGEWVDQDPKIGVSYFQLHRFIPVDMRVKLSMMNQTLQQNSLLINVENNKPIPVTQKENICNVSIELDAKDIKANIYQIETTLSKENHDVITTNQLLHLKGGSLNQFNFQFRLPSSETYTQVKRMTCTMSNMRNYNGEDELKMKHPAFYTDYQSFIVCIVIEKFGLFNAPKKEN